MKKEQQVYIAAGLGIIMLGFVYFNVILAPVNKSIKETREKIKQTEQVLAEAQKEADNLEYLQAQTKILEMEVKDLQQRLPKGKELPDLIRRVVKVAQMIGIRINNYQLLTVKTGQDYDEFPVALDISGNFHSVGNFLAELGQEERIFSMSDLTFAPQSVPKEGISVSCRFTMIAFIAKGGT